MKITYSKLLFQFRVLHFIWDMLVSKINIWQVKFWTRSFHMWIKYFLCENVPISYVNGKISSVKMFQFQMFFRIWNDILDFHKEIMT